MRRTVRRGLGAAAATLLAGAAIVVPATPAMAIAHGCTIGSTQFGCSTPDLPANPVEHAVVMTVFAGSGWTKVTCRVHDSRTGDQVGILSNSNMFVSKSKRIGGLYGRYFLSCIRPERASGGGGSISNG